MESAVRNCDNFQVTENDVKNILNWKTNQNVKGGVEVAFKPARVILQVNISLRIKNNFKKTLIYHVTILKLYLN